MVKYDGGSVFIWGCMSAISTGTLKVIILMNNIL